MTTYAHPTPPAAARSASTADGRLTSTPAVLVVAVVAGLALGAGDLLWMLHMPPDWNQLANSSAIWAFAAFVLGAALRLDPLRSALSGVVLLVVAVEAYYAAAAWWLGDSWSVLTSEVAIMWLLFGVIAGVVFGVAGTWAAGRSVPGIAVGTALGASVLLAEALGDRLDPRRAGAELLHQLPAPQTAMVALAVVVLLTAGRRPLALVGAVVACVPLTLFCVAGFAAAGFAI